MRALLSIAIVAAASVSACGMLKVDAEADATARGLYEQLRTGADLSVNPALAPELRTPQALAQLATVRAHLPPGTPTAVANRSWSLNSVNGQTSAKLVHAYSYPQATVLAQTVLAKGKDKTWKIVGFHLSFGEAAAPRRATPPAVSVEDRPQDI